METLVFCDKKEDRSEMTRKQKREYFRIISKILSFTFNGSLKTHIMLKVNLSYAQLQNYISMLVRLKLLEVSTSQKATVYRTTEKGMNFLRRFNELDKLLKSSAREHVKKVNDPVKPSWFGR
jgi:predicted transcriptional regulator